MEKIIACYEQFKHLDELFSDREWLPPDALGRAIYEMWKAISETAKGGQK